MYKVTAILLISIILLSSARDVSWFKQTQYHKDNIIKIETSWRECDAWSDVYYSLGNSLSIKLGDFVTSTTVEINSTWKFNITGLCLSLDVPLDWDDNELDETINYTIARVYARNDIQNSGGNGAFWLIPGVCLHTVIYIYM